MQKLFLVIALLLIITLNACKPACPIMSCHTRKVHLHGKKEFRGQPIWKKQNPRIGEKMPKKMPSDNQESQQKSRKKD